MRAAEALFKLPCSAYSVRINGDEGDLSAYELEPLLGATLAAAYVPNRILQGYFIIAAKLIAVSGPVEDCYLDVTLPERISEHHFRLQDGRIIRQRGRRVAAGTIIPAIAIEAVGPYSLYVAKESFEAGIHVLETGLREARDKGPVALDLAYLLRDAGQTKEAVQAFTTAIQYSSADGPTLAYYYRERASLFEKLGNKDKAEQDRFQADLLQRGTEKPI
jgi:tetratricopeptide (TPR) repeat protein